MQKIKYTNPRDETVEFCGSSPYIFEKVKGITPEAAVINADQAAGQHGKKFKGLLVGDREVTLNYHVEGSDKTTLYANNMNLMRICSSMHHVNGNQGRLEYSNEYGTWWIPAIVKIGPSRNKTIGKRFIQGDIVFYCEDPYWREEYPQSERLAFLGGGFKFPLSIDKQKGVTFGSRKSTGTIYNFGDSPSPLIVRIIGPAKGPTVSNLTTGEFIRLNTDVMVPEGSFLEINTYTKDLSVEIVTGDIRNDAIGYISLDSTFFQLPPGINKIGYNSEDDSRQTQIYLEVYSRFGGV